MIEIKPSGSISAHRYFSPEAWKGVRLCSHRYLTTLNSATLQQMSQASDVYAFAMSAYEVHTTLFVSIVNR
jgi:hypothetical protein